MHQARHRATRGPNRAWLAAGVLVGVLVGGAGVLALWSAVEGPPWQSEAAAAGDPGSDLGSDPAADDQTGPASDPAADPVSPQTVRSDRGQQVARSRIDAGVAPAPPPSTAPVLLLGDSLAVGIEPYLEAGLGQQPLTTDAAEGRRTYTQVDLLSSYAASSPDIWIVSLGTNDSYEEFPDDAAHLMALAGPTRCVVWFDVWRPVDDDLNAALAALAAEHPNLHLVPWHDTAAAHPEWFSGTDVHPSSSGYAVRGQMGVDAVAHWCGAS